MKISFQINGSFDFDFDEKRQQELIEDSKYYPGGITSLLFDNLEVALAEALKDHWWTWTMNPKVGGEMLKTLIEKGAKADERDETGCIH